MKHHEPEKNQTKVYLGSSKIQSYREKLTHYCRCCFSIPPEKPKGFLKFSGGIEKQQRVVMG